MGCASADLLNTATDDELKATLPAGYKGDPRAESKRRPGTD